MIQFVNVAKKYPRSPEYALKELNFQINDGDFVFLIGPSGSGKTTIMKMLIRDERPSEGKIFFDDYDITKINRGKVYKLRRLIGVVFQDYKLIAHKNAYENVAFAMEVAGQKKKLINETVKYVLDIVGLGHKMHSFPSQLSGGEQQRVAIARAIANNPRVLIADEPTGNLDPASAWDIVQILSKINSWGTTVVMSTHGTDIVNSLNKRVIQLQDGQIVRDDNKGQYELTKVDFSDKVLQAQGDEVDKEQFKNVIKVDLRTEKIRARLRDRQKAAPQAVAEADTTEPIADQVETTVEPAPVVETKIEQPQPTPEVSPKHKSKIPFLNLLGNKTKDIPAAEHEPEKIKVDHVDINNEMKKLDSNKTNKKISKEASEIAIEKLDVNSDIIESLQKAGYKFVSDIIEVGPEKLVANKVINPIEVIEISQAIGEFVEFELDKDAEPKVELESKPAETQPAAKPKKQK